MIEGVIGGGGEVQSFNILISLTEKSGGRHLIAAQIRWDESVVIIFKEQFQCDSCEPPLLDRWRNTAVISLMFVI